MRPISGLAGLIDAVISLNLGPEVAQPASSPVAMMIITAPARIRIGSLLWLHRQWFGRCYGREGPLDREIESHQRSLVDDDVAFVDVRAFERDHLIPGSIHLSLRDGADELPCRVRAQCRRIPSRKSDVGGLSQSKALPHRRRELCWLLDHDRSARSEKQHEEVKDSEGTLWDHVWSSSLLQAHTTSFMQTLFRG